MEPYVFIFSILDIFDVYNCIVLGLEFNTLNAYIYMIYLE